MNAGLLDDPQTYDPDQQKWDESSLAVGSSVCEVFCSYFDQAAIDAGLAEVIG